jgi:hypothetical protein
MPITMIVERDSVGKSMFLKNSLFTVFSLFVLGLCLFFNMHMVLADEKISLLQPSDTIDIIEEGLDTQDVSLAVPFDPVKNIISKQLTAIQKRDAESAFSMITDNLNSKFDNANDFLGTLHFEYRPIYNYKSYSFIGGYNPSNKSIVQKVKIESRYGDPAIVIYNIRKQDDGKWLINSFTILDNDAPAM